MGFNEDSGVSFTNSIEASSRPSPGWLLVVCAVNNAASARRTLVLAALGQQWGLMETQLSLISLRIVL